MIQRKRVFIVEDNANHAANLKAALSLAGFESMSYPRGSDAVEQARAYQPAGFVLDVWIDSDNTQAEDLVPEIRQCPNFADVPIILISSHTSLESVTELNRIAKENDYRKFYVDRKEQGLGEVVRILKSELK